MIITEKIRLYPTKSQRILIDNILLECKNLYNFLLECNNDFYDSTGWILTGKNDCDKFIKQFKCVYTAAIVKQRVHLRVIEAIERLVKGKIRKPKFKSINEYRSFDYPISSNCKLLIDSSQIMFSRIGKIKANFTRKILGKPKTVTLKKLKSNDYYAYITIDCDQSINIMNNKKQFIGIDLGIKNFLTTTDGEQIKRPVFLNKKNQQKLSRAQRKLSHKKYGSKNYEKQRVKYAKIYQKLVNRRRDHHFKVAHWLVNTYETICCEDLKTQNFITSKGKKDKSFRKIIMDISLGEFLIILRYMGNKYSSTVIDVDPKNTTQECSVCGSIVHKSLNDRQHICPICGLDCDRDLNAAWNILKRGTGECGTTGTVGSIKLAEIKIPGIN